MKALFFVLALAVSLSTAGDPTATGAIISRGTSSWQGSEGEFIYWSQLPTGSAMGSQYFPDMYPDYDAGVADDFEFLTTTPVTDIRWWGGYWNGSMPLPIDSPVEIYLYLDDGSGNAPTLPQHTSAIRSWMIPAGYYSEVSDGSDYRCEYELPVWIFFEAETKYWLEIRKAMPFDQYGQYGWIQSEPVSLSPCVQGFDGLGIIWWTAQTTDAAFELIYIPPPALDRSTWAEIKTIF